MGVNSLPKTATWQRRSCDLNPGPSAPESSTLTTRLPSHPFYVYRLLNVHVFHALVCQCSAEETLLLNDCWWLYYSASWSCTSVSSRGKWKTKTWSRAVSSCLMSSHVTGSCWQTLKTLVHLRSTASSASVSLFVSWNAETLMLKRNHNLHEIIIDLLIPVSYNSQFTW